MRRLCTICARAGSKGVPNKNLRILAGKPLLAHSIQQAKETGLFEKVAVSSDSTRILEEAERWGADVLVRRPEDLATDECPKLPVIRHCVTQAEKMTGGVYELITDLDATSPLRRVDDICGCVSLVEKGKAGIVITGSPSRRSPYFNLIEKDAQSGEFRPVKSDGRVIARRQDAPPCFDMNASIYVWVRKALFDFDTLFTSATRLFQMPEERSLDIDSEFDFEMVDHLLNKKRSGVWR